MLLYTDILNGKQDGLLAHSAVHVIGGRFTDNASGLDCTALSSSFIHALSS